MQHNSDNLPEVNRVRFLKNLHEKLEEFRNRRRRGAGVVEFLVGLMVTIIIAVGVVLPVTQDAIKNANITGTAGTILGYVPMMIVIGIFLLSTRLISAGGE